MKLENTNWSTGGRAERRRSYGDNCVWREGTLWHLQPWDYDDIGTIDAPEFMPAGSTVRSNDYILTSICMRPSW